MKLQVGDRVKVLSKKEIIAKCEGHIDFDSDYRLGNFCFVEQMTDYCDTFVTITLINKKTNTYNVSETTWVFNDECFDFLSIQTAQINRELNK